MIDATLAARFLQVALANVTREYPRRLDHLLAGAVETAARKWYRGDRDAPLAYEPSLADFVSPAFQEGSGSAIRQVADSVSAVAANRDRIISKLAC